MSPNLQMLMNQAQYEAITKLTAAEGGRQSDLYVHERPLDKVNRHSRMLELSPPTAVKEKRSSRLPANLTLDPFGYDIATDPSSYDAAYSPSSTLAPPRNSVFVTSSRSTSSLATYSSSSTPNFPPTSPRHWSSSDSLNRLARSRPSALGLRSSSKLCGEINSTVIEESIPQVTPLVAEDQDHMKSKLYQRTMKAQKAVEKARAKEIKNGGVLENPQALQGSWGRRRSYAASDVGSIKSTSSRRLSGWFRSRSEVTLVTPEPVPEVPRHPEAYRTAARSLPNTPKLANLMYSDSETDEPARPRVRDRSGQVNNINYCRPTVSPLNQRLDSHSRRLSVTIDSDTLSPKSRSQSLSPVEPPLPVLEGSPATIGPSDNRLCSKSVDPLPRAVEPPFHPNPSQTSISQPQVEDSGRSRTPSTSPSDADVETPLSDLSQNRLTPATSNESNYVSCPATPHPLDTSVQTAMPAGKLLENNALLRPQQPRRRKSSLNLLLTGWIVKNQDEKTAPVSLEIEEDSPNSRASTLVSKEPMKPKSRLFTRKKSSGFILKANETEELAPRTRVRSKSFFSSFVIRGTT